LWLLRGCLFLRVNDSARKVEGKARANHDGFKSDYFGLLTEHLFPQCS
jgi:hypothetical protein